MKKVLNYVLIFVVTLVSLVILQNLVVSIPNKFVTKNIEESLIYYKDKKDIDSFIDDKSDLSRSLSVHYWTDCVTLNIIHNIDTNESLKSQILMNFYDSSSQNMCKDLDATVNGNESANVDYSRYWHGTILYIKPLLMLMNIKGIKIFTFILLLVAIIYLFYLLLRKSIKLSIMLALSLVAVMVYAIPLGLSYFPSFFIMLVGSIIVLKNLKKEDRFFYKLFVVTGVIACFFDFLVYEVLTLVFPLFLKVYFDLKDNRNNKELFIFIIKCIMAWGFAYVITFASKWLLSAIVLGKEQFLVIWKRASMRIYSNNFEWYVLLPKAILKNMCLIFPFSLFENGLAYLLVCILIVVYNFIFNIDTEHKRKYYLLFLVVLPCLVRLVVLFVHTWEHDFFDYRFFFPIILICLLILYESFSKFINNKNKYKLKK